MQVSDVGAKPIPPYPLPGTAKPDGPFLIPPSHGAFLKRVTSTLNKGGVRRLALQEVARHFEKTTGEEAFIPEITTEEEDTAWKWTLQRTLHFANMRKDIVAANRMATKKLAECLLKRVYQLRNARSHAALCAPHVETRQERLNRSQQTKQLKMLARRRPGLKPMSRVSRVPSRISPQQSASSWHEALQQALRTRGKPRAASTGR